MFWGRFDARIASKLGVGVIVVLLLGAAFVVGSVGNPAHRPLSVLVGVVDSPGAAPPLTISSLTVSPDPATQGSPFTVSVSVSGGTPPYSYSWNNIPGSCTPPGNVSSWQCSLGSTGQYSVSVTVTDAVGNHTSNSQSFSVNGNSGNGNGNNHSSSNGNNSGFNLSAFGPIEFYALIAGVVVFGLLIALTVGVYLIAVTLRRLPRPPRKGLVCPACQATAPPGSKFCPACASPLTPSK